MRANYLNNKKLNTAYWLYLHPYVHVSIKKNWVVLYNTLNSQSIEYEDNLEILGLIKRLKSNRNLYVIRLNRTDITNSISKFIDQIRNNYIGDLVDTAYSSGKPVQFMPKLCLQKSSDILTTVSDKDRIRILERDHLKNFLETINLYINEQCSLDCGNCKRAFKQFPYCFKTAKKRELSLQNINDILENAKGSSLNKLNILGGNIFNHSEYFKVVERMNQDNNLTKTYFSYYLNIPKEKKYLDILDKKHSLVKVLIDFPLNKEKLREAQTLLKQSNVDSTFQFIVEGEKDVEGAEHVISQNNIEKFGFSPYFNGNNTSFFKKNVFIDRDDILSSSPSMNEIFARMTLNRFNVGTITIFSNKDIYANVNHSKLGKLGEKDLFLFIARELRYGKSWARIRKNVNPCKRCVFNTLCPPITNYEYALGYYNLCHIMKETNG